MTIITSEFHIYRLVENVRIYIVWTVKINKNIQTPWIHQKF